MVAGRKPTLRCLRAFGERKPQCRYNVLERSQQKFLSSVLFHNLHARMKILMVRQLSSL